MRVAGDQVVRVDRLAAQLGVEVQPAAGEAAALQHVVQGQRHLRQVVRELVGVPAQHLVAAVHVDGAEDAQRLRQRDLVLEAVAGEQRVVLLDVDLDLLLQAVRLEEAEHRGDVVVVLVLGGLGRLGLDQDGALEADLVLVLDDELQEAPELRQLARGRC